MRPLDVADEVMLIKPSQSMLVTALMVKNRVNVDSYVFKSNEQDIDAGKVTVTAINGSVLTLNTDEAKLCRVGQTLRVDHDTAPLITAVDTATDQITVSSASGISQNDVAVLGSAGFEELSGRPTAISRVPSQIENYVETLRDAYGQSRHVQNERYYGGSVAARNRDVAMWEHKRFIDRGLFYNVKTETTQNGQKLYKTNGLFASISTNVHEFSSGNVSWAAIQANLVQDIRFMQGTDIWLFCSLKGAAIIERIVREEATPVKYEEAAGISVKKIGLMGKWLHLMIVDHFEADTDLEKCMVGVDPSMIEVVTTQDQKTKQRQWMLESVLKREQNTDGTDGSIGEFLTDFGLRLHNEKSHFIWWNANAYSA
jgi:hypothetical protein